MMPNDINKMPVLSFFTGAGFMDIGFLQEGFDIVWHNEYNPSFVKAFEYGMSSMGFSGKSSKVQNTDSIVEIGPNQVLTEAFGLPKAPDVFGVIGGPPCPDFSVGGKNRGQKGDNGRLSEVYVNRILELNPTFFVFENVPGLFRTEKHREFLVFLMNKLKTRYSLDVKILNALDYGVPQDRERVFMVGFQKKWLKSHLGNKDYQQLPDSDEIVSLLAKLKPKEFFERVPHWFPWPEIPRFKNAKHRFDWPLDPVPEGHEPKRPPCPTELMVGTYICDETRFDLPNSDEAFVPKSSRFTSTLEGDVSKKSFKKLHRYRYSPAVAYGNNEVHLHPTLPRRLTVREALMLQSVPNQYILPSELSLSDKFKTIGNGVPVRLAQAVAGSIQAVLSKETLNHNGNIRKAV